MRIVRLRLKNLNSLRDEVQIDFSDAPLNETGLFAIVGDTGAGKTTLLDAITLAMYGRIHRNKNIKEILSYGATDCMAEVEFETAGKLYLAQWNTYRARNKVEGNIQDPRRKLSVFDTEKNEFVGIAEKIREVDLAVENITGLDYDRFSRSALLAQGDFAAFLKATEKERSDLLERITGTEIYSLISEKAFNRFREEESKLNQLVLQRDSMELLSEGDKEARQKEADELNVKVDALRQELSKVQEASNWLKNLQQMELQLAALEEAWTDLQKAQQEAEKDEKRLQGHQKALPLQKELVSLDYTDKEIQRLHPLIGELEEQLPQLREQIETSKKSLEDHLTELKQLQKDRSDQEVLFEQVDDLDRQISHQQQNVELQQQNLNEQLERVQDLKNKLSTNKQEMEAISKSLKKNQEWLDQRKDLAEVSRKLPAIQQIVREQESLTNDRNQQEQEYAALKKDEKEINRKLKKVSEELDTIRKQKSDLERHLKELEPERFALARTELLEMKNQELEQIKNRKGNFDRYLDLLESYRELLSEQSRHEEQILQLRARESDLNQEMLSSLELLTECHETLQYKRDVYEQQQAIANYERDRQKLKEGDPCPLCGAVHHPFREHAGEADWKPREDQAKNELRQVEQQYNQVQSKHQQLLKEQYELYLQLEHLSGAELDAFGGRLRDQMHRMLDFEGRMAGLFKELELEDWANPDVKLTRKRKAWYEQALQRHQDKWKELLELDKEFRDLESRERGKQDESVKLEMEQRLISQREDLLSREIAQKTASLKQLENDWKTEMTAFPLKKGQGSSKQMLEELEKLRQQYETHKNLYEESGQKLNMARERQAQWQSNLTKEEARSKQQEKELDLAQKELESVRKERIELFGDKNWREERKKIEDQVQNALELEKQLGEKVGNLQNDLRTSEKRLADHQQNLQERHKDRLAQEKVLASKLEKAGFSSEAEAREALLDEEEASELGSRLKQLNDKAIELKKSRSQLKDQLEQSRKEAKTEHTLESLYSQAEHLNQQTFQLQRRLGAISRDLEENAQREQKAQQLLIEMETQKQEFNRWSALNALIGSKDGKKFRVFAQGLTLQRLVSLANKHLQHLNARYVIKKRAGEELELDIIDTYQANNKRSMNTLSGGESFLVSLALALGLSDLAGRRSNIRSLFIDEGFGTLDEATLDMAISTLENLQASGKTIGIISHVKELKERISTQIQVLKKGSGFSEVRVTG